MSPSTADVARDTDGERGTIVTELFTDTDLWWNDTQVD